MLAMNAWLLDFGDNCMAAVGTRELLHLVDAPVTFPVPYTPAYCRRVVSWQERLLPVMDIATRLGTLPRNAPFLAVVGYQQQRGEHPQFGALKLASPPRQLAVDDAQACALPEENGVWRELAISCFEHQSTPVPVLDLRRIFGNAPRAHYPIETGAAPSAHDTANEES